MERKKKILFLGILFLIILSVICFSLILKKKKTPGKEKPIEREIPREVIERLTPPPTVKPKEIPEEVLEKLTPK